MAGGGMGAAAPTSTGQGGGLPMAAPAQQAPVGAPPPAEPTGLQFGTAGVGTGIVQAPQTQAVQPMARQMPYAQNPYQMQQMQRPMYQPQLQGLQAALMQMMNRYGQPAQRQQFIPQYQNQALQYRPNMAAAQTNLKRTATSQAEAQAAAAAKAAAALSGAEEDQDFANWLRNNQRQQYEASKNANYGGG